MIRHFFLDKTNTIIENNHQNFGLNPISSVGFGSGLVRSLIHFDIEPIKTLIEDGTFIDEDKLKITINMTNCFSVAGVPYETDLFRGNNKIAKRGSSLDVMLFELPCPFDAGRGFDYITDFWNYKSKSENKNGSSWYQSRNCVPWSLTYDPHYDYKTDKGGIYTLDELEIEYNKYKNGLESIIVGTQHFDFGDENLCIDITKYVLKCIKTGVNYGLCLSCLPFYEKKNLDELQIIDFFNDNTNTFFHPYIEVSYDNVIEDCRDNFIIGRDNKLYLYVYNNGVLCNLDKIPTCTVNNVEFEVKQCTKGVYYALIPSKILDMEEDVIYYDLWSNIVLNGDNLDDIELEFVALKHNSAQVIGSNHINKQTPIPFLNGINDNEDLSRDEVREVFVEFREKYTNDYICIKNAEYRLYVKDGDREIDVFPFQKLEMENSNNFFLIYGEDLIPNRYFVDIKINSGRNVKTHKDVLHFNIVSNVTNRYQ